MARLPAARGCSNVSNVPPAKFQFDPDADRDSFGNLEHVHKEFARKTSPVTSSALQDLDDGDGDQELENRVLSGSMDEASSSICLNEIHEKLRKNDLKAALYIYEVDMKEQMIKPIPGKEFQIRFYLLIDETYVQEYIGA